MDQAIDLRPLPRTFFAREANEVARDAIGKVLVHETAAGRLSGRIVETEAYAGSLDPASHSYRGRTARNGVMWGAAGHAYVYLSYGVHVCINLVTGNDGVASAVLVRSLEAMDGAATMRRGRVRLPEHFLCSGPGRLTVALGLTLADNGRDITRPPLYVVDVGGPAPAVAVSPRVGVSAARERLCRYFDPTSRAVSVGDVYVRQWLRAARQAELASQE